MENKRRSPKAFHRVVRTTLAGLLILSSVFQARPAHAVVYPALAPLLLLIGDLNVLVNLPGLTPAALETYSAYLLLAQSALPSVSAGGAMPGLLQVLEADLATTPVLTTPVFGSIPGAPAAVPPAGIAVLTGAAAVALVAETAYLASLVSEYSSLASYISSAPNPWAGMTEAQMWAEVNDMNPMCYWFNVSCYVPLPPPVVPPPAVPPPILPPPVSVVVAPVLPPPMPVVVAPATPLVCGPGMVLMANGGSPVCVPNPAPPLAPVGTAGGCAASDCTYGFLLNPSCCYL